MFLKNTTTKEIKLTSFDGYVFVLPSGVSAIWNKAGAHMVNIYAAPKYPGNTTKDKFGLDNGHGMPAVLVAQEKDWERGGRQLAQVSRFPIKASMIPRAKLIVTALQRGVERDRCTEFQVDSTIDTETIAKAINDLPVPEAVKRPIDIEKLNEENSPQV